MPNIYKEYMNASTINKILNEEWRSKEQLPEIIEDMKKRREDKNKYK